jgi:hypothetical protein
MKSWFKGVSCLAVLAVMLGISGCEKGGDGDDNSSPSTNNVADLHGVIVSSPFIVLEKYPLKGRDGNVSGMITLSPIDFNVAVYLKRSGKWWVKPHPYSEVALGSRGHWDIWLTTEVGDADAKIFRVYVVPKKTKIPQLQGSEDIPAEIAGCSYTEVYR